MNHKLTRIYRRGMILNWSNQRPINHPIFVKMSIENPHGNWPIDHQDNPPELWFSWVFNVFLQFYRSEWMSCVRLHGGHQRWWKSLPSEKGKGEKSIINHRRLWSWHLRLLLNPHPKRIFWSFLTSRILSLW